MKNIENAIMQMSKEDAKLMKYIGEQALHCVSRETEDVEQEERLDEVVEMIITTAKQRVFQIASKELENNF